MKYLVIELEPQPKILSQREHSDSESEPVIFETKQDAFRAADKCKKGLVYPITDLMRTLENIKVGMSRYIIGDKIYFSRTSNEQQINDLFNLLDEII